MKSLAKWKLQWELYVEDPRIEYIKLFQEPIPKLNPLIESDPKTNDTEFSTYCPLLVLKSILHQLGKMLWISSSCTLDLEGYKMGKWMLLPSDIL